ncbi:hypothetical protein BST81_02300 [Leptolyngbya sp. 'hensonii']|uniref:ATP-binding protein n=1 Tax=Leptolyngbya sp. 'hensonii' TaxID=1922337 RepID=UPI000950226F|nr:ATP-binding protein [Leptolyngbya sp. 'hensonii']OLP20089.1 hypothetical protein BST81_02300 [Leptolyngbya sp. 'hensonii']
MELRVAEIEQVSAALQAKQSVLVLGEPGAGKSWLGQKVADLLKDMKYQVAIANYSGSAKETLISICEQLGIPIETQDERPKAMTAEQLRKELLLNLPHPKTLMIIDDAHRFPASLRYWLEDCHRAGVLLLLLATAPPAKDIFLKMPRIEMQPLKDDEIRTLMYQEAMAQGMTLNPGQFADLQQRAGNNPALAKRVVREALLGVGEAQSTDHHQYVDGTPFLIAGVSMIGMIRFVGLGLGDRSLYILGGVMTLVAVALRVIYYSLNRKRSRL